MTISRAVVTMSVDMFSYSLFNGGAVSHATYVVIKIGRLAICLLEAILSGYIGLQFYGCAIHFYELMAIYI